MKLWQVSMQMPMREWCSFGIRARRSLNSEREPPMVLPWPHIVSSTGTAVVVSVIALVRVCARRESASGRGVWFVLPGLGGIRRVVLIVASEGCSDSLEVV